MLMACIVGFYIFIFPIVALLLLIKLREKLENTTYKNRFGSLYLNLKTTSNYYMISTFIFLMRRLIFACMIVFMDQSQLYQILANIAISLTVVVYLLLIKPIENKTLLAFEIYNEVTLLLLSYMIIPFADIVTDG